VKPRRSTGHGEQFLGSTDIGSASGERKPQTRA
jgi:hypothetical protein